MFFIVYWYCCCSPRARTFTTASPAQKLLLRDLYNNLFRDGLGSGKAIARLVVEAVRTIKLCESLDCSFFKLSDDIVAGILVQQTRRSPSAGRRCFRYVVWCERVLEVNLHTVSSLVRAQTFTNDPSVI